MTTLREPGVTENLVADLSMKVGVLTAALKRMEHHYAHGCDCEEMGAYDPAGAPCPLCEARAAISLVDQA